MYIEHNINHEIRTGSETQNQLVTHIHVHKNINL
jgi:hypothetical protein